MFSADQISTFVSAAAIARETAFPSSMVYEGRTYPVTSTGIKTAKKLAEAGFAFEHDAIVRLRRAVHPLAPILGKTVVLNGQRLRISEIVDLAHSPEWRLGLERQ